MKNQIRIQFNKTWYDMLLDNFMISFLKSGSRRDYDIVSNKEWYKLKSSDNNS